MTFLSMPPRTTATPWPFLDVGNADELRDVAYAMEDSLSGNQPILIERAGLLYIRAALLDLADRKDRDV